MTDPESATRSASTVPVPVPDTDARHQQAAWQLAGREVDLYSERELQQFLFEELALPATTPDQTTDTPSLTALRRLHPHPFLDHLLAYRAARAAAGDLD
ncbi:hypothetical protein ACQP1O_20790 [Nocardia sp. CA-151230]|uniref:hypothetical protein n=1 Tax=Nocardia sp. CA-151230 TaxID=3239982 RepID=UPI003D8D4105